MVIDLVLATLDNRTAAEAIAAGEDPRAVWLALCDETDVPASRRYGTGRLQQRGR